MRMRTQKAATPAMSMAWPTYPQWADRHPCCRRRRDARRPRREPGALGGAAGSHDQAHRSHSRPPAAISRCYAALVVGVEAAGGTPCGVRRGANFGCRAYLRSGSVARSRPVRAAPRRRSRSRSRQRSRQLNPQRRPARPSSVASPSGRPQLAVAEGMTHEHPSPSSPANRDATGGGRRGSSRCRRAGR